LAGCAHQGESLPTGTFGHARATSLAAEAPDPLGSGDAAASIAAAASHRRQADDPTTWPAEAAQVPSGASAARPRIDGAGAVVSDAAPAGGDARGAARRTERKLREALANAEDPRQAGLDLAGFLVREERHVEALHVIDLVLGQVADPAKNVNLRLARAGLLRDVARPDLAASELRGVIHDLGPRMVSPATWFDLAQVEWVNGDLAASQVALETLQRVHGGDPWALDHKPELAELYEHLALSQKGLNPLANGTMRDMFALLRAGAEVQLRMQILDSLTEPKRGLEEDRSEVRMRAIAIACGDESAAMRARAVQLAAANQLDIEGFWLTALRDVAPIVRSFAATGIEQVQGAGAAEALLQAISAEQDPATFSTMHVALAKSMSLQTPPYDAEDVEGRKRAVAQWRLRCQS